MVEKKNFFWNKDIKFHFENTINWEKIVPLYEEEGTSLEEAVNMYKDTLNELGTIIATELAETAKDTDEFGTEFENGEIVYSEGIQKGLKKLKESDALALNVKREYGGPGMPGTVYMINLEMICRADPAFMTIYAFYSGVAKILERFASEDLKEKYIPKLARGEYSGSMALTESDAGSDLGNIITKAEKKGDHWEITGTKTFITNGNGDLTLILARSDPNSEGIEGISMYLVPRLLEKDENKIKNFNIERVEHKLGIRGSPTTELNFEKSIGYLVGKEGEGIKQMFYLMNEARLGVAAQALGIAEAALTEAKKYTKQRIQFNKPICKHELVADKLFDMETDVKAIRSLLYKAIEYEDLKTGLEDKLKNFKGDEKEKKKLEREFKKYSYMAREMIPLVKYFATECCIEICRDALQLHGGYGFTTEYPVERFLRDSIITTIYEGTSQMQALMATKDTLKKSKAIPYLEGVRGFFKKSISCLRNSLDKQVVEAETELNKAVDYLRRPFLFSKKNEKKMGEAISYSMLCAERLTRLKAYTTMAKFLVEEAKQFSERKMVAKRFLFKYMPKVREESAHICSGDKSILKLIKEMDENRDEQVSGFRR